MCSTLAPDVRVEVENPREGARLAGGAPYFAYSRRISTPATPNPGLTVHVVQALHGDAAFALATDPACALEVNVGEWGFVATPPDVADHPGPPAVAWAPWSTPTAVRRAEVPLTWSDAPPWVPAADVRTVAVGPRTMYLFVELATKGPVRASEGAYVWAFDPGLGAVVGTRPAPARWPTALAAGAVALHDDGDGRAQIVLLDARGRTSPLWAAPAPYEVTWLTVDNAGASATIVWIEQEPASAWLLAAPFDGTSAPLRPRRKVPLTEHEGSAGLGIVANRGLVLDVIDRERARVSRLSDGRSWTLRGEPGSTLRGPLWVDADAAWIAIDGGLLRIAYADESANTE